MSERHAVFLLWLSRALLPTVVGRDARTLVVGPYPIAADPRNSRDIVIEIDLPIVKTAVITHPGIDHHDATVIADRHLDVRTAHRVESTDCPVRRPARRSTSVDRRVDTTATASVSVARIYRRLAAALIVRADPVITAGNRRDIVIQEHLPAIISAVIDLAVVIQRYPAISLDRHHDVRSAYSIKRSLRPRRRSTRLTTANTTSDRRVNAASASTTLSCKVGQVISISKLVDVSAKIAPLLFQTTSEPIVVHHHVDLARLRHYSLNIIATLPPIVVAVELTTKTVNCVLETVDDPALVIARSTRILEVAAENVARIFEISNEAVYIRPRIYVCVPPLCLGKSCHRDDTNEDRHRRN